MKGKLLIIGGNVDKGTVLDGQEPLGEDQIKFFEQGILERMLSETGMENPEILIVTTASLIPEEVGEEYKKAFKRLGQENITLLYAESKNAADDPTTIERLKKCRVLLFTGGDQCRLAEIFTGTKFHQLTEQKLEQEQDFIVAGTSAGAMVFSKAMIGGGKKTERIMKGGVYWGTGLGLTDKIIIDTHFIQRHRFNRLIEAVATHPSLIGVGLGEDTAVLIKESVYMETIGSGLVIIMDARETKENSIANIEQGENICLEKIILHILPKGRKFNLSERAFVKVY